MNKDMFFKEDEIVVQYHPAKSEYVNNMPNCLHLWRPTNGGKQPTAGERDEEIDVDYITKVPKEEQK